MLLRILPWAVWVAMMIFSIATFSGLPADIPQHLNAAGEVTRSVQRSWMSWLALPLIAAAVQVFMTWLTLLLPSQPELFNFPGKESFLKLPEDYRGDVITRMQQMMDIIGALTMLIMFMVQALLWRTALGHASKNTLPFIMIGTVVFLPVTLILVSRVSTAAEAAEKKWRAATAGKDWRTSRQRSATDR